MSEFVQIQFSVEEGIQISMHLAKLAGLKEGYIAGVEAAERLFAEYLQAKQARTSPEV